MSAAVTEKTVASLSLAELEALIRRVVREELARAWEEEEGVVYLDDDSPLYQDLLEIRAMKERGELNLLSHEEVWGDELSR
ncbi:MAG: hypothetical protein NUW24_03795 [Anaerolineae bacterium]|jgi:hypothetical protein|nr:hypothetical protein [Anaerolineae bacterium]MDH7475794.1 hypothetical protein [Anaerolineae bacterium]